MLTQLFYMILIFSVGGVVINISILRFTFLRFLSLINADTLREQDPSELLKQILEYEENINNSRSFFIFIYLLITAYLWLLWANFAGTTVFIYKPNDQFDVLFILVGYFFTAFAMRYARRLMESRLSKLNKDIVTLPEFGFISVLIFCMFIFTMIYPDAVPSVFSWLSRWIY